MTLPRNIFRPWDETEKSTCGSHQENEEDSKSCYSNTSSKLSKASSMEKSVVCSTPQQNTSCANPSELTMLHTFSHCALPCGSNLLSNLPGYLKYEPSSSKTNLIKSSSSIDSPFQRTSDSPSNLFLYPVAINELANLSRNDLTAIGLLPPETPSTHRAKRQRPKRFHCPHCQVAFSNNGQLRGHIRIHTGLRPFPCSICGKKFGRKDHLKKHTRTHQRVMYTSPAMIGYGSPFQPFHPPILSTAVSNDLSLPSLSSIPPYGFSMLPTMTQSHYPSL
ncbi:unnamed protein product [Allacma fusca]|uniref:C2H2-type domain-containing protein n=1 Tax=Allacma fusca TaxID=39272 RepID=A0A8J2KW23_9HEXA|nr:unnamed protein product [Allacma fusca]